MMGRTTIWPFESTQGLSLVACIPSTAVCAITPVTSAPRSGLAGIDGAGTHLRGVENRGTEQRAEDTAVGAVEAQQYPSVTAFRACDFCEALTW